MTLDQARLKDLEGLLQPVAAALDEAFQAAAARLPDSVPPALLRPWVEAGVEIAGFSLPISKAYFEASPAVLPRLGDGEVTQWARLAHRLHRGTAKSVTIASELFGLSPLLLDHLAFTDVVRLGRVLEVVAGRSPDQARLCMAALPETLARLAPEERGAFIDLAASIGEASWPDSSACFRRTPELLDAVEPFQRLPYLDFAARATRRLGRGSFRLFAEASTALSGVSSAFHGRLIEMATELLSYSASAAMALIKNGPVLTERLGLEEIEVWHAAGVETFRDTGAGGDAFFRLESGRAQEMIRTLTARVDLAYVSDVLRLYGKALTGARISVQPISALEDKGIDWASEGGASTEGTAIYLPDHMEEFADKQENFAALKVYATNQIGRLEFGSFDFDFRRAGNVLPSRREDVESERRREGLVTRETWLTDMERFFDLFEDRQLAADLFKTVEDLRVDSRIGAAYSGIRGMGRRLQEIELGRRPNTYFLPLRQAFVENLVRASLGGETSDAWPEDLAPLLSQALAVLESMRDPAAIVEDAAEATLLLYDLAAQVPNLPPGDGSYIDSASIEEMEEEGMNLRRSPDMPGTEVAYQSADQVNFHGDFKPELVQLLTKLREAEEELTPGEIEEIKALLEKSVEVDLPADVEPSELSALLENLTKAAATKEDPQASDEDGATAPAADRLLPSGVKTAYYPEWDYHAEDYRPRWCAVRERRMEEGESGFFDDTLAEHAGLVKETQRQFELLKPETFRKLKRLESGEDIDLDAAIEFVVQRRAGHGENEKIYWRRNKVEREVAVAFLIDLSSSTDARIVKHPPSRKRIIDLEKESLVLLTRALETIGDRYGIYGFSGDGRDNVEYYVIKDFNESFGDSIRRRIDRLAPLDSTRMGAAIRHTIQKLLKVDARSRILFLVSDGRPQDVGYGPDPEDKDYAVHDTHRALMEAKEKSITPFALTVDKEGHEYLGEMCGDLAYEVLSDIELLPSRLPALYRMLTA